MLYFFIKCFSPHCWNYHMTSKIFSMLYLHYSTKHKPKHPMTNAHSSRLCVRQPVEPALGVWAEHRHCYYITFPCWGGWIWIQSESIVQFTKPHTFPWKCQANGMPSCFHNYYMYVFICVGTCVPWCVCADQGTSFGSRFSPTMYSDLFQKIKCRISHLGHFFFFFGIQS